MKGGQLLKRVLPSKCIERRHSMRADWSARISGTRHEQRQLLRSDYHLSGCLETKDLLTRFWFHTIHSVGSDDAWNTVGVSCVRKFQRGVTVRSGTREESRGGHVYS